MEKYLLLFILSCCGNFTICNAQTITVRGRVTDRKTGEVLSDANIGDLMSVVRNFTQIYRFSLDIYFSHDFAADYLYLILPFFAQ